MAFDVSSVPFVRDDHAGIPGAERDPVQLTADALAGQRVVDHGSKALSGEVVENAQYAEASAVDQGIRDEVKAPALVRSLRDCHRRSGSQGSFAAATLAHGQPLLPVEPIELLPVDLDAFPLQQDMQATISEASLWLASSLSLVRIATSYPRVSDSGTRPDRHRQPAGPALRAPLFLHCPVTAFLLEPGFRSFFEASPSAAPWLALDIGA
jgi:hypothetical protein